MKAYSKIVIFLCVVLLLLVCVQLSNNASINIGEYQSIIDGDGLYNKNDDVEILTKNNFKDQLYGAKNIWVIEFYNTWCGHCQRFAPSYKALARNVLPWKDIISIGAIDCSDKDNYPTCRNFEVMGYPTVRYFHENFVEGSSNIGEDLEKGIDMEGHKKHLVLKLIKEQKAGRGKNLPNLLPYNNTDLNNLLKEANENAKYSFLIIDRPNSTLGVQLALDFHNYKEINIRYATTENEQLIRNLQPQHYPLMMVITTDDKTHKFTQNLSTRKELRSAIVDYVKPLLSIQFNNSNDSESTRPWYEEPVPDIKTIMEAKARKDEVNRVKKLGDIAFQADFDSALRYSLQHEVGSIASISGEKLKAFHDYLTVLLKYAELGPKGGDFLKELLYLTRSYSSVAGKDVSAIVTRYDDDFNSVFMYPHRWVGCQGSVPHKRGYPCGLWRLFHYLTVKAAEHNEQSNDVLSAMYGYIVNFFGCRQCSGHFKEMAQRNDIFNVVSANASVRWLWSAHNEVNKRLHGDVTEDAEFPKIVFPSPVRCPTCRNDNYSWNYNEVDKYLKHIYGDLKTVEGESMNRRKEIRTERSVYSGFERLDASMCFIIYVISFILILILIRIFLKRGYRKKLYSYDLLGKV